MSPRLKKLASDWNTYLALVAAAGVAISASTDLVTQAIRARRPFIAWEEAQQFIRLNKAGPRAATQALRLALEDKNLAQRAFYRVNELVALAIGLDPGGEHSKVLFAELVEPTLRDAQGSSETAVLAAAIASRLHLPPSAVGPSAQSIAARIKTEADPSSLLNLGDALTFLSGKLGSQDATTIAAALVARMRTETNPYSLADLGHALGSLNNKLKKSDVAPGAAALIAMVSSAEANSQVSANLDIEIFHFVRFLGDQTRVPAFEALVTRTGQESDVRLLLPLARSSISIGHTLAGPVHLSIYPHPVRVEQVYVDLLKSPFLVGEAQAALLKGLEQSTGQTFSGDLWNFVDWATQTKAGRALNLDLDSPPPWQVGSAAEVSTDD
ncbi:MAG: hypothetical protein ABJC13_00075 [Acidobacteriota bacterium]